MAREALAATYPFLHPSHEMYGARLALQEFLTTCVWVRHNCTYLFFSKKVKKGENKNCGFFEEKKQTHVFLFLDLVHTHTLVHRCSVCENARDEETQEKGERKRGGSAGGRRV